MEVIQPKKLLNENCDVEDITILKEAHEGQQTPSLYITGPFIGAEKKNRNGRIYPLHIIEREVKKYQDLIKTCQSVGELNHPETGEINPERAAILITELTMNGNYGMGKARVCTHTPMGKLLQGLILDGIKMGVSTRGTGNLTNESIVCDDYNLITIDAVYMPSCPDAYVDAVNESAKWVLDEKSGLLIEKKISIDQAKAEFDKKLANKGNAETSKIVAEALKQYIFELKKL